MPNEPMLVGRWLDVVRLRLRSLVRGDRVDAELDRELRAHLEHQIDENVARGMTREDARLAALRAFGGIDQVKEEARDARGVAIIDNLTRDLRYTLRGLARQPMLLLTATISIALGAGANIAVFSLAKELLFAAPDARDPQELVQIDVSHSSHATYQRWLDLKASGVLADIAGYSIDKQVNWLSGDAAVSLTPMLVTANFFDVTGVPFAMGRGFSADEARAERDPRVVVLSDPFWRGELAADSGVVGRSIVLNGESYTILGVLAPGLRTVAGFGISPNVYVPLNRALVPEMRAPDTRVVTLLGRLKPDQSLAQGRAALDAVDRRLSRLAGDTLYGGVQEFTRAGTVSSGKTGRLLGGFFGLLAAAALFVLVIACANVAGLLIARATARRQEIAVRLALGGTRARLLQQFLVEGFWLALIGSIGGMALSVAFMRLVNGLTLPVSIPIQLQLKLDGPVFLCAFGLVLLSMVFCALLPALNATRLTLTPALKREEPQYASRRFTARAVLLAGQVTVSTVLLVTAFLFVRNLARTQVTNPGFEVDRALVAQIGFVAGRPATQRIALLDAAVERARSLPGIERVAYSNAVALTMQSGSSNGRSGRIDASAEAQHMEYSQSLISPDYFSTLGIRLQGREFLPSDRQGAPSVAIVNEEFVRRYFGGRSPIGSVLQFVGDTHVDGDTPRSFAIVGVAANSKHRTIGEHQRAAFYLPLLQHSDGLELAYVLVRTRSDPATLVPTVRQAIGELDRSVAVEVETMRSKLAFALLPSQVTATLLGTLGTLGLLLAMFGLYAMVSYTVSRRVSEIAIRSAIGASRGRIVRLVMRDASLLVGIGLLLGLTLASLVTQPLARFLVAGLSTMDPLSFVGTAAAFGLVSLLASWLPARRAARIDPALAMRLD